MSRAVVRRRPHRCDAELDADGPANALRLIAEVTAFEPHDEFPEPVHMWGVRSGDGPAFSEAELRPVFP